MAKKKKYPVKVVVRYPSGKEDLVFLKTGDEVSDFRKREKKIKQAIGVEITWIDT